MSVIMSFVLHASSEAAYTSVNDLAAVEVGESIKDAFRYLAKYFFSYPASKLLHFFVDTVKASSLTVLHGDRDYSA